MKKEAVGMDSDEADADGQDSRSSFTLHVPACTVKFV